MYNYPYGDNQQINLNWIISEIIALHQRLDPDYTAPTFTQIYPFSDTQQLNLDWILTELKALKELAPTPAPTDAIDEVGRALIAGAYDSDTQYQKNDYIVQDGKLYRANAATTGTFDPTKWREVMLGDDLAIITRWADATNTYLNNLAASNVSNDSNVAGDTVKDALGNLNGAINSIAGDLAPVLTQLKADTNLVAGDLRVYNNQLYRVTQAVSSGASLILGTNIGAVNLSTINQTYSGTANSYTKMADGTLIQWGEQIIAIQETMTQVGSLNLYYGRYILNFDLPFKDNHYSMSVQTQYGTGYLFPAAGNPKTRSPSDPTSISATIWFYDVFQRQASETASLRIRWCAIGRWK